MIAELKRKHIEELEEHVRNHNTRYSEMLKERLEAEDLLETQHKVVSPLNVIIKQKTIEQMECTQKAREEELRATLNLEKKRVHSTLVPLVNDASGT